jgi:hypothetical protein
MVEGLGGGGSDQGNGIAFLVSAGVMYEIIAAACSSPQTTELNAGARADTLMKWVNLGVAQGILFVAVAAYFDRQHRTPIIAGAALASALLYAQYVYAKNCGLNSDEPGTEDYGPSSGPGASSQAAVAVPLVAYAPR